MTASIPRLCLMVTAVSFLLGIGCGVWRGRQPTLSRNSIHGLSLPGPPNSIKEQVSRNEKNADQTLTGTNEDFRRKIQDSPDLYCRNAGELLRELKTDHFKFIVGLSTLPTEDVLKAVDSILSTNNLPPGTLLDVLPLLISTLADIASGNDHLTRPKTPSRFFTLSDKLSLLPESIKLSILRNCGGSDPEVFRELSTLSCCTSTS
jgi:hypothetical protein